MYVICAVEGAVVHLDKRTINASLSVTKVVVLHSAFQITGSSISDQPDYSDTVYIPHDHRYLVTNCKLSPSVK